MEADLAVNCFANLLEEFEIELLGEGVFPVEVADSGRKCVNARGINKGFGPFGRAEGLSDRFLIYCLGMDVAAAPQSNGARFLPWRRFSWRIRRPLWCSR